MSGWRNCRVILFLVGVGLFSPDTFAKRKNFVCRALILQTKGFSFKDAFEIPHVRKIQENLAVADAPILRGKLAEAHEHEVETAKKIQATLGVPVFLTSMLYGFKGSVPVFDGVIFDQSGAAAANLSLKSLNVEDILRDTFSQALIRRRKVARNQLNAVYSPDWLRNIGFKLEGNVLEYKEYRDGQPWDAESIARFMQVFGIFPEQKRKTIIVVDVKQKSDAVPVVKFQFFQNPQQKKNSTKEIDMFMSVAAEGTSNIGFSVTQLANLLKEDSKVSAYMFMAHDEMVLIDGSGYRVLKIPQIPEA